MTNVFVYLLVKFRNSIMKKIFFIFLLFISCTNAFAQIPYVMGYEKADIEVIDPRFFSTYQLPDMVGECGVYDKNSATFYTCDYKTYRNIDADMVKEESAACCEKLDFDPHKYYGTLTLKGVIEHVEWDSMVVYFKADKARLRLEVDEREIDALYDNFYKENYLGRVALILTLKTYDTPKENVLSYNKNTEQKIKPTRTFTRILRW